ncbi:MAG: BufA2 family periplasmic bufferin-type metallophore [Candidatus Binatia bacterium]
MKKAHTTRILLASAVAGLLAIPAVQAADEPEKVHCYGINKCKGTGDCSGKGHSCGGQNACAGQGHINLSKDVCLRIKGGHLTPAAGEEG